LIIYSQDVTPESAKEALAQEQYARALLLALHLNERPLLASILGATPAAAIELVCRVVPAAFLPRLLEIVAAKLQPGTADTSPHIEFYLMWCLALLQTHGSSLRERSTFVVTALRSVQKALVGQKDSLVKL
jgi:periodic tryptophan protein 2